jgi:hypothetical protein
MENNNQERIKPVFSEEFKKRINADEFNEYYIYRPDTDVVKLAMGIHGVGVPFKNVKFDDHYFYVIENTLWRKGETSVDCKGPFVVFWRLKEEFKGY